MTSLSGLASTHDGSEIPYGIKVSFENIVSEILLDYILV